MRIDELEQYYDRMIQRLQAGALPGTNEVRAYNMSVAEYSVSQQVTVVQDCFAFMFTNIGDTIARVNGMVIFPSATPATALGDSRSISGHVLDLYKGNITLAFNPGGLNPLVEVVQLFYVTPYKRDKL